MLDATLTTEFLPGTNLKGGSAGANWTFVLPSLELDQVVVAGAPLATTLITLARHAQRVVVIGCRRREFPSIQQFVTQRRLENVTILPRETDPGSVIQDGSVDLVFVAGRFELSGDKVARGSRSPWQRWLAPHGHLYFETSGLKHLLGRNAARVSRQVGNSRSFWLTPLTGESHTFVPIEDHQTIRHFREQQLTSLSLRSGTLKQAWQRRHARQPGPDAQRHRDSNPPRASGTSQIKTIARAALRTCNALEQCFQRSNVIRRSLGRRGVLVGPLAGRTAAAPPEYLQSLARDAGVSIESCRWGLSASGDYDSRKLVFFLFEPNDSLPAYVVKMTRSGSFNHRLNQERRGLEILEEKGIGDRETLPRVVFAGTRGGLSIVGETAIRGVAFDWRTTGTAACPHARRAIDWLTELGAATADPLAAEPGEVAAGLQQLLSRFAELYAISPEEEAFLQSQIAVLQFNSLPLVFQHGDPGRWNLFVTSNDRISFLDWEAAEPNGLPLWDLFYFLRSFCVCVARKQGRSDSLQSLDEMLLQDTPMAELVSSAVKHYCTEIGVARNLVEPLFYTCWMHRALKESMRLTEAKLHEGHYFNLLRRFIQRREAPALQRLFTACESPSATVEHSR